MVVTECGYVLKHVQGHVGSAPTQPWSTLTLDQAFPGKSIVQDYCEDEMGAGGSRFATQSSLEDWQGKHKIPIKLNNGESAH